MPCRSRPGLSSQWRPVAARAGSSTHRGFLSGPIVKDRLFFRVGADYVDRSGYFDNVYLNTKQDPFRDTSVQGLLKWLPDDKFSAELRGSFADTPRHSGELPRPRQFQPGERHFHFARFRHGSQNHWRYLTETYL